MQKCRHIGLVAILLLLSCQKEQPPHTLSFRTLQVRSLDDVGSVHLYAFRKQDGLLETSSVSDTDSISIRLTKGREYHLYLLANRPDASGHYREADFISQRSLLEENDIHQPEMVSILSYHTGDQEPPLEMQRFLCKISIGDIAADWMSQWAPGVECTLETIALLNVSGGIPLSGIPDEEGPWYNCAGIDATLPLELKEKLVWDGEIGLSASPADIGQTLYAMPNPSEGKDYGIPWTVRRTRIALKIRIDGCVNWYPIDLPAMQCNTDYRINSIVINGPGSTEPDEEIDRTSLSFDMRVEPWESKDMTVDFK